MGIRSACISVPMVRAHAVACQLLLAAAMWPGAGHAFPIDTGDPDLTLRWDNHVRYNLGLRARSPDRAILNNTTYDNSDSRFDRGEVVMNRVDLLTEFDLVHRKRNGLRVSAAFWYDHAYRSDVEKTANPGFIIAGLGDTVNVDAGFMIVPALTR